jgi:hypothetical protein
VVGVADPTPSEQARHEQGCLHEWDGEDRADDETLGVDQLDADRHQDQGCCGGPFPGEGEQDQHLLQVGDYRSSKR